ncbi:polysaccharide biosynthesis/export family protein [Roseimaritima sediminicola]|uniref:polysaccharide biosynthesis/export family protein n=1 Tax=Roseimaritima sediminicola TaxID=2662066 RepID=UPI00129840B3|nr:polysaccharide biosynthesis/export family protein [Roseimaritima sediminicola]
MRRITPGLLILWLLAAIGCSHAQYSAANLPPEFAAPHHVSARHVDLSQMPRTSTPSEWLQPGDTVELSIATGIEKTTPTAWTLRLDDSGAVDVPLVGPVPIAGLTPNVAADRVRDRAIERGVYVSPKVTLTVDKRRSYQITVVGAVNEPDTYEIPATSCDLMTALTMAKGVSDEASRFIEIRHTPAALSDYAKRSPPVGPDGVALASFQPQSMAPVVNVDLADLNNLSPQSLQLLDGSVVSVTREPKRVVSVMGLVNKPDQIEMPDGEDLTLLDAIAQAGGTTLSIADKVHIIRSVPETGGTTVIEASLANARSGGPDNLRLAPGDVVSVEETPSTVALQTIRSFFRVGFSAAIPGL